MGDRAFTLPSLLAIATAVFAVAWWGATEEDYGDETDETGGTGGSGDRTA